MRFPFALVTSNISRCVTLGAWLKSANPKQIDSDKFNFLIPLTYLLLLRLLLDEREEVIRLKIFNAAAVVPFGDVTEFRNSSGVTPDFVNTWKPQVRSDV